MRGNCPRFTAAMAGRARTSGAKALLKYILHAQPPHTINRIGAHRRQLCCLLTALHILASACRTCAVRIINSARREQDHWAMALTTVSWALVEVPRYLFYVFNLLGDVPYPLFWLRYSLFALLYPT
jgi:Protein tyrosine phosphatase-like protein, PTPLA